MTSRLPVAARLAGTAAILVLLAAAAPAAAVPAAGTAGPASAGQDGHQSTRGVTVPRYQQTIIEQYRVPTNHGTIYGEVVRPDPDAYPDLYADGQGSNGPGVPVILTYSPYNHLSSPTNQAGSIAADATADYFAPRGYARAVFDLVGTRESSGCYDYGGIRERETGAAVVDYLGARDWANGEVGMIGASYNGTTQLATAIEQPEHLTAIIPQVAIDRWYDYAYGGGIRYLLNSEYPTDEGFDTPLAFDFGFGLVPPADATQPHHGQATVDRVRPCDAVAHTEKAYRPDPVYDEFWRERDYRRQADKVQAAVFLEGGWLDHNVKHWDTTRFFKALGGDTRKKMAIGQWNHSDSQFGDAQNLRHAWFDHWLLGLDTGVMDLPAVDTETNDGTRHQEASWPPPGTATAPLTLSAEASGGDQPTLGQIHGADTTYTDDDPALTEDDMFDDCGEACLVFTSTPVDERVRISGSPTLDLRAASEPAALAAATHDVSTHYTPVLFDEAPDGTRQVITRGFLNARNRAGLDESDPVRAGVAYDAPVELWDTDWVVKKGHKLGVAIASANAVWAVHDDDRPATNTVYVAGNDAGQPVSVLRVPVSDGHCAVGITPPDSGPATGGDRTCQDRAGG